MPLVSVIVPFFDAEDFLQEAIESVIHQDYTNWELILVDDGSTDGSNKIVQFYTNKYPERIFYLQHEEFKNKGAAASRNLAITHAKGDLIAFLDSDDVWEHEKLAKQVSIFIQNPKIAMLCEASKYWYSWQEPLINDIELSIGAPGDRIYYPPQLALQLYPLAEGTAPCPSGVMIKASVLKDHKGFEESFIGKFQMYEDQAFFSKIYLNEIIYVSSQCNNFYRQRIGSVTQIGMVNHYCLQARYYFLQWLTDYLNKAGIQDKRINKLLRNALFPYRHPYLNKLIKLVKLIFKSVKLTK